MHKAEFFNRLTIVADIRLASGTSIKLSRKVFTLIVMVEVEGRQIGRKDRLLGEIGTMRIPLTPLSRMGPPAERE